MKNELDCKTILSVFEYIQGHGEAVNNAKCINGISAFTDHDGYTVYLKSNSVTLTLGFHNTYHLDYQRVSQKDEFFIAINKLYQIANANSTSTIR
jgi:hypothetical protein